MADRMVVLRKNSRTSWTTGGAARDFASMPWPMHCGRLERGIDGDGCGPSLPAGRADAGEATTWKAEFCAWEKGDDICSRGGGVKVGLPAGRDICSASLRAETRVLSFFSPFGQVTSGSSAELRERASSSSDLGKRVRFLAGSCDDRESALSVCALAAARAGKRLLPGHHARLSTTCSSRLTRWRRTSLGSVGSCRTKVCTILKMSKALSPSRPRISGNGMMIMRYAATTTSHEQASRHLWKVLDFRSDPMSDDPVRCSSLARIDSRTR
mmetsp:Transcript_22314/g.53368  ORF Transcript_22314/g.53368 Transcript_22314/m.53368 type:complete len:269 (-) Transcript_22314:2123-2929(-)